MGMLKNKINLIFFLVPLYITWQQTLSSMCQMAREGQLV
jgi:hypothetical protein